MFVIVTSHDDDDYAVTGPFETREHAERFNDYLRLSDQSIGCVEEVYEHPEQGLFFEGDC